MGMYTELHFNSKLKKELPQNVLETLQYMIDHENEPKDLPEHELFKSNRWTILFTCDSCDFDADTHSTLRFDKILNAYYLCIRANLKNYDSEIEKFIDWIMPYLEKAEGEFLGFYRDVGSDQPFLIYKKANQQETNDRYCPWVQQEDGLFDTCCGYCGVGEPEPEWTHCPYCSFKLTDCTVDAIASMEV